MTLEEMLSAVVQKSLRTELTAFFGDQPPRPASGLNPSRTRGGEPPRTAFSVAEVAASLGISERQVYALCARGEIESFKEGRRRLVPVDALKGYVRDRRGPQRS